MKNKGSYKVSVIIPVYNVEPYLRECIESVIHQTLRETEIVIVDDGSTDKSGKICDEYASIDDRIKVIHKPNGGLSSARNEGLKEASGEYLFFLDSDDFIELNALEELYYLAEENNLDLIMFTAKSFVDKNLTKDCEIFNYNIYNRHINEVMNGMHCLELSLKCGEYITCSWARFYRSSLFEGGKRVSFCEGIIHEDLDVGIITLLQSGRVMKISQSYYNRRYRSGSIMTSLDYVESAKGYLFAASQMMKFYDEIEDPTARKCLIRCFESYLFIVLNYYLNTDHLMRKQIAVLVRKLDKEIGGNVYKFNRKKTWFCLRNPNFIFLINLKDEFKKKFFLIRKEPEIFKIECKIRFSHKKKIYLLGSPLHGNLGDHLIAMSETEYFKKYFGDRLTIDCPMPYSVAHLDYIKKYIQKDDIIFLSGGGWLGTKWRHNEEFARRVIKFFPDNLIVILPQTVFYEGESNYAEIGAHIYSEHKRLLICLREKYSYKYIIEYGFAKERNVFLMPDFALLYKGYHKAQENKRKGIMVCFRDDLEKILDNDLEESIRTIASHIDTVENINTNIAPLCVGLCDRKNKVNETIDNIGNGRLLITDRLHAMLFAVIAGTPCLAFDNATHKILGVYEWVKDLDFVRIADKSRTIEEQIKELILLKPQTSFYDLDFTTYEKELERRIRELDE